MKNEQRQDLSVPFQRNKFQRWIFKEELYLIKNKGAKDCERKVGENKKGREMEGEGGKKKKMLLNSNQKRGKLKLK